MCVTSFLDTKRILVAVSSIGANGPLQMAANRLIACVPGQTIGALERSDGVETQRIGNTPSISPIDALIYIFTNLNETRMNNY